MEKEDGVWRTIRGRRIFIRSGESLGSAMSRSGKFKDFKRNEIKDTKDVMSRNDKVQNAINKKKKNNIEFVKKIANREDLKKGFREDNSVEEIRKRQAEKNRINENARVGNFAKTRVNRNWAKYSREQQRELAHEDIQKRLADYKNNKINEHGWTIAQEEALRINDKSYLDEKFNAKRREQSEKDKVMSKAGKIADYKAKKQSNNKIETSSERQEYEKIKDKYGRGSKEERKAYFSLSNEERGKMFNEQMDKRLAKIKEKEQSNNKIQNNNDEFDMRKYTIELQHDKGTKKIDTIASSKESAIKSVLKSENAPDSAVKSVKDNGSILNKQSNNKITQGEPLKDLANDRIKEKQNTLANDKAMLEAMKRKGIKEVNGWAEKDFENRINKNEDYLKQSNNKVDSQDMPYERDLQDVVKSLNDEGSDFSWNINEYKDGKANLNVGVFMPDERGYVDRDVEFDLKGIKGNTAEGYSQIEDKIREWQDKHSSPDTFYDDDFEDKAKKQETIKNYVKKKKSSNDDWLPKATEIKEQGKSNRKEVSDNIQAHILSYYDSPQDFVEQMDVFDNLPTTWHRGEEMAKEGFYSVYYDDQRKFLDDLKINPNNKKFSDDKVFKTYTSLIGRESAKLYDKIKKHQADTINNYKKRKGK